MAKEKEEQDLKKEVNSSEEEENPQENESDSTKETTPEEEQPLKKDGEDSETGESSESQEEDDSSIEEMLSDGTPADKDFRIKKSKYDELNEKSSLYDQFSPLLAKLRDKPELVEEVMENKKGESVEKRLERLEEATKEKERNELRTALSQAVNIWPDFRDRWDEIRPLFKSLENQGIDKREALQRAYFAANPEAARKQERLTAQQHENARGKQASAGGATKRVVQESGDYDLTDADKEIARQMGISPEAYKRHAQHIEKFKYL